MSFFIRKRHPPRHSLTKTAEESVGQEGRKSRPRNTDFKTRPTVRKQAFGGKRKGRTTPHDRDNKRQRLPGRKNDDEEIESSSSDEEHIEDNVKSLKWNEAGDEGEEHSGVDGEDETETAQEKKIRLAKLYLTEIEKVERRRKEDEDVDVDTDLIAARLKDDVLESEGRLRKEVADLVEPDLENVFNLSCSKYLKRSVTCLCISSDDDWIFSGSKDGHLMKWSVKEKRKVGLVQKKQSISKKKKRKLPNPPVGDPNSCHSSSITAICISTDGKFLATGDLDAKIVIWDPNSLIKIHIFTGHRGAIRGLTFRKGKHTLYSSSDDRSVRIWDLDAMGYVESLFGHQDAVTCIDALTRERALTGGGRDGTIRIWKIVEESQLVYNGHASGNIDCVKLVNEENFVSGGDDGVLCAWNVNRKKPLVTIESAHGKYRSFPECETEEPNWISSITAWTNTDLIASGASDGFIKFWKCGQKFKSLTQVAAVDLKGWANAMEFSSGNDVSPEGLAKRSKFLAVAVGKENKLGRWFDNIKNAKNGIVVIPLKYKKTSCTNVNDMSQLPNNVSTNESKK